MNNLYYGDNLHFLRGMESRSAALVYLDPPFNSKSTYNLLFHTPEGDAVQAQTAAFKDTWRWEQPAAEAFEDVIASGSPAAGILRAFRSFLGESDMMAYLAMMAVRLIEMRRVLKDNGSLYLHCDPTASHYLKLILDAIFGPKNFRNEVIWKRTGSHNSARRFGPVHDVILYYACSDSSPWNQLRQPYEEAYKRKFGKVDDATGEQFQDVALTGPGIRRGDSGRPWNGHNPSEHGRHWQIASYLYVKYEQFAGRPLKDFPLLERLDELDRVGLIYHSKTAGGAPRYKQFLCDAPGVPLQDVWTDISAINSQAHERLGYPTQKPITLLERIIDASSNKGDVVLDPFCGCGTTIEAAERLERNWIGIDVTHHAINIIDERMRRWHPKAAYEVKGRPEDLDAAHDLAKRDPYEFQWWANWLLGVQNYLEKKKGADRGIDGIIYFRNGPWGVGEIIVSVKSGQNVGPDMIAALSGTVQREDAQMGIFVCLAEPTRRMRQDAAAAGMVKTAQGRFQKIQIVTVAELMAGLRPPMPQPLETDAFRRPLRPARRAVQAKEPDAQLSFQLPIPGGKKTRRDGIQEHLSGRILAELAAAAE